MPAICEQDPPRIVVLDSITKLTPSHAFAVAISGSHGGAYSAALAALARLRGAIFSDAGIGLDRAGIGGLVFLDSLEVPAAAVDYRSARIGDGGDIDRRGIISHVNEAAARLCCRPGDPARTCAEKMLAGAPSARPVAAVAEGRMLLRHAPLQIWGLDSNSLVAPRDAGSIIVSGSHGGLLGGRLLSAIGPEVLAAAFNDAGIGMDRAGISRLPALDQRRIAGVTVSAASARIGDARSSWETGVMSACNKTAASHGGRKGMRLSVFFTNLAARAVGGMAPAQI